MFTMTVTRYDNDQAPPESSLEVSLTVLLLLNPAEFLLGTEDKEHL